MGIAPILAAFRGPAPQARWTVLIRLILLIPQFIVWSFLTIAVFFVAIVGWFGALFTKRLPPFAADFISGWLRWSIRLSAYEFLLTDAYPPFSMSEEPGYPVQLAIPPARQLNRLAVFFRFILVIPASIVALVLGGSFTTLLSIVGWLVTLVTGRLPRTFFDIFSVVLRYQARLGGYYLMLTPEYPHQPFGDTPPPRYPGWELEPVPAARAGLIVLVVLNVLGLIAYVAVTAAASHGTVQNLNATVQVQSAYTQLSTSLATYERNTTACASKAEPLQCVTGTDAQASAAFASFQSSMTSIDFPSDASASAATLAQDAGTISDSFTTLAGATSASEYQQLYQSSDLTPKLQQFDQDYRSLVKKLE